MSQKGAKNPGFSGVIQDGHSPVTVHVLAPTFAEALQHSPFCLAPSDSSSEQCPGRDTTTSWVAEADCTVCTLLP